MKILGPILVMAAVYLLFIHNEGALFMQIVERLGAWFADRLVQDTQQ